MGDAEWFLKINSMVVYNMTLQVKKTSHQGWLLYLTRSIDHMVLSEDITSKTGVEVALWFKYINTYKYEPKTDECS